MSKKKRGLMYHQTGIIVNLPRLTMIGCSKEQGNDMTKGGNTMKKYTYCLDMLRDTDEGNKRLFLNYDRTVKAFGKIEQSLYYTAEHGTIEAESPLDAADLLFIRYNRDPKPEGYTGRSMSVSDIIRLWDNEPDPPVMTTLFCDSINWKEL